MSLLKAYIVPHPPLIVPAVGRGKEKAVQKTLDNFKRIAEEIAELKPDTIILSSPHAPSYRTHFYITDAETLHGDLSMFAAPEVQMSRSCDRPLIKAIETSAKTAGIPVDTSEFNHATTLDHGSMVPLYFILKAYTDFSLVRIAPSDLSSNAHYKMGKTIQDAIKATERQTVFIASGDLSHKLTYDGPYGYHEAGPAFDQAVTDIMKTRDLRSFLSMDATLVREAAQCGLGSFIIMAGALSGVTASSDLLSYEGPFGVGYAVARFTPTAYDFNAASLEVNNKDSYAAFARETLETYFNTGKPPAIHSELPSVMRQETAGVFVTLKAQGALRGCIGTLEPTTQSIAEEIRRNALQAAFHDPRFTPVHQSELNTLDISVDVLGTAEEIDAIQGLDPKTYGVIVNNDKRKGVLLPNLDGIDTAEEQVSIALRKAGISPDDTYTLKRFKVHRHHE